MIKEDEIRGKFCNSWYKAVLFDKDGVLLDTNRFYVEAWQYAGRIAANMILDADDINALEGMETRDAARLLLARNGLIPNNSLVEKILEAKDYRFAEIFKLVPYPGAVELVQAVRKNGISTALVTGSRGKVTRSQTEKLFTGMFDAIVTPDIIAKRKPNPDPWLKAASILDIDPIHCIVIENAPLGITAAKKAGMDCIAVSTTFPKGVLAEADMIYGNPMELLKFIRSCSSNK